MTQDSTLHVVWGPYLLIRGGQCGSYCRILFLPLFLTSRPHNPTAKKADSFCKSCFRKRRKGQVVMLRQMLRGMVHCGVFLTTVSRRVRRQKLGSFTNTFIFRGLSFGIVRPTSVGELQSHFFGPQFSLQLKVLGNESKHRKRKGKQKCSG